MGEVESWLPALLPLNDILALMSLVLNMVEPGCLQTVWLMSLRWQGGFLKSCHRVQDEI
jgi:hypothetical protein